MRRKAVFIVLNFTAAELIVVVLSVGAVQLLLRQQIGEFLVLAIPALLVAASIWRRSKSPSEANAVVPDSYDEWLAVERNRLLNTYGKRLRSLSAESVEAEATEKALADRLSIQPTELKMVRTLAALGKTNSVALLERAVSADVPGTVDLDGVLHEPVTGLSRVLIAMGASGKFHRLPIAELITSSRRWTLRQAIDDASTSR